MTSDYQAETDSSTYSAMDNYDPRPDILKERTILVTGTADGIGAAVAMACATHGAAVIVSDKEQHQLEPLYDKIEEACNIQPAILPLDLETADEKTFAAAAKVIEQEYGHLDGLAHCAAFAPFLSRIDDYDASEWERVLRVNLTGPFMLTQACLPLLRESDDASIVFTSDRVGRKGFAYWGAFSAAKFATEGLMQTLAEETDDNSPVRVNSLDPGIVRTGLRARLYPGENPNDLPSPESVAPRYLYLLGPDTKDITGQAF